MVIENIDFKALMGWRKSLKTGTGTSAF
jgi:hypothetical protein